MNYTDKQLKTALAMMLPELIFESGDLYIYDTDFGIGGHRQVFNTELLHLCWLAEKTLSLHERFECYEILEGLIWATWQQRVAALAKVKGIGI